MKCNLSMRQGTRRPQGWQQSRGDALWPGCRTAQGRPAPPHSFHWRQTESAL